ncbi:endo-1,4-beta-xylanase [Planktothrix sp. FACHB-1355]|uniref:Beta-xylanase n=1 Tax=Aerosakkonema funiforme FACHB-1375 TaxID=2949571 RepID=A0A926VBT9_9CYAN|nr:MULTISPECIES: endo-1,4-beta-xylanase [Oscillatoriales]MBD2180979.1 endo-1,4-beta-xylanase [Aerosakkonema funiforme FACHB-1375]MBD3560251.1 endo-1,4-beta-xylanase [Planktothrix sp. FACHB-1355]
MHKNRVFSRRRALVFGVGALAGVSASLGLSKNKQWQNWAQAMAAANTDFTVQGDKSMRERAAAKGLIYGAASDYAILLKDPEFADRFGKECGILVPEGMLKMKGLRPTPTTFNFTRSDWLLDYTQKHNMLFRGHTLVWHNLLPDWFKETVNAQNAEKIMVDHIKGVAGRYAGKMHSWDVVNEAVYPWDGRSDGLRNSPWLDFLGPDYIEIAFRAAAEADPNALLVYNDNRVQYDTREGETMRTVIFKLLERLKSKGVPVQALGIQSHLWGDEVRFNPEKYRKFLSDVASLGLKILITELDVTDLNLPQDEAERDRIVAKTYEDYLSVVLDEPAVVAVLNWGLSDRHTWLSELRARPDGSPVRPLPFDRDLKPKLAWNAIARAFDQARPR